MARVDYNKTEQLSPEQIALLLAQTKRLGAQSANETADIQAKRAIADATLRNESDINASKIGLGDRELGSKEKVSRMQAALEALQQGSKETIASQGDQSALAADVLKRTDLDPKIAASTLASMGQPGLYNALAQKDVDAREKAVNAMIPTLQQPMSGGEAARSKKFKAALEAAGGPGAYDEALARAYPATANGGGAVPKPALYSGPAPTTNANGSNWAALATQLLGNNGETTTGGGAPTRTTVTAGRDPNYPVLPNTPETSYTGLGHGSLEGSQPVAGGITTPSGGYIGTPNGITPGLASLIAPRDNTSNVASATTAAPDWTTGAAVLPNPNAVAASPTPSVATLLAAAAPTPTPAPVIAPTATPVPQATPQLTPDALALLLKQQQQPQAY